MNYADIRVAREEAEQQIRIANTAAKDALVLVAGRLRQAMPRPEGFASYSDERNALRKLKRELRDFDAVTGRWKAPR